MAIKSKKGKTQCKRHSDCFANKTGRCICLSDTNFGNKECPFFKTEMEVDLEQVASECMAYAATHSGKGGES